MKNNKFFYLTIDTGTTNTRVTLWSTDIQKIDIEKKEIGVRNTAIEKSNQNLKKAVKECILTVLKRNDICFENIKCILGSGMITSNVGLFEIPHLIAPVGEKEILEGMKKILLEDVAPIPIWFIPGVKNQKNDDINFQDIEAMDIMRGEEIETIGLLNYFPKNKNYLFVLPGSHTKFVSVDSKGNIVGCLTSITGEILSSITNNTIIADSVGKEFATNETYDKEFLLKGYDISRKTGLGRAAFSTRILNQFLINDKSKLTSYLLGAVLASDMQAVKNSLALKITNQTEIVIAGKDPLKRALVDIFKYDGEFKNIYSAHKDQETDIAGKGSCYLAKQKGIL